MVIGSFFIHWYDILDIVLVALLFYSIILFIKGTRALSAIYGLLILAISYVVFQQLELITITWILEHIFSSLFLVIVVLFQKDIRQALSLMGSQSRFRFFKKEVDSSYVKVLVDTLLSLSRTYTGALIVIERNMPLGEVQQRGVPLNAVITKELLETIFWPKTPLHDGAVLIRGNKIVAAACILPLAVVDKHEFGTRHRAALGVTEESDAITLVVSEERGHIRIATKGKLTKALDENLLHRVLKQLLR